VNYPHTEQQINDLKEAGIVFDKVIYLSDGVSLSEDLPGEPGSIVFPRMRSAEYAFTAEQELEYADNHLKIAKEFIGDELVKEVSIRGS
jgi:hypothetical protein